MLIHRNIFSSIKNTLKQEPIVVLLLGPRQSGKTTLLTRIMEETPGRVLSLSGDDIRVQETWSASRLDTLTQAIGDSTLVVIDEAQRIANIGVSMKLLFDATGVPIIASGSASFDLATKASEPLTGRATTFILYPISLLELPVTPPETSIMSRLEEFLRFGMYPKTLTLEGEKQKQQYLYDLVNNYLYRDILTFTSVRKPKKVIDLLSLLSLQLGNEVSLAELGQNLSISRIIVEKYLDILEKMFIIVNIRGFSRNLRKEISKTSKYYFVDLGLRNALMRNFNPLSLRSDSGVMFENFCVLERMKALANRRQYANHYFWRTYDQQEIDLIEEREGKIAAYECKLSALTKRSRGARDEFLRTYRGSTYTTVSPSLLLEFLQ